MGLAVIRLKEKDAMKEKSKPCAHCRLYQGPLPANFKCEYCGRPVNRLVDLRYKHG